MKKEISEVLNNYRECLRHTWNTYFRILDEGWHEFINVERELFVGLVLVQVYDGYDFADDEGEYISTFSVELEENSGNVEILWSKEKKGGHWKWEEMKIGQGDIECRFIDFFDWNQDGFRDFRYLRCKIIDSKIPHIVGADILIEQAYSKVFFCKKD